MNKPQLYKKLQSWENKANKWAIKIEKVVNIKGAVKELLASGDLEREVINNVFNYLNGNEDPEALDIQDTLAFRLQILRNLK